jgi:pimeloyl-ACP methyl ester carboxylesterase
MKIILYISLIFIFGANAMAQGSIQPLGKIAGQDQQGNAIYQIHANGIDIGYKLIGSGEPLLMIMGIANTMERWPGTIIEELSKKYQLILLDNRGMGYTTANDEEFTYKLFADDVIGLLDTLKIKSVNVFGVSMGSVIAQELLLEYSQRINKAIICATTIDRNNIVVVVKNKTLKNSIVQRQLVAHWKSPLEKLSHITNQVLLVVGTSDEVVGVESSKTLATTIPGAWLVQFKNASHLLVDEAPIELAKVILAFLDINQLVDNKI